MRTHLGTLVDDFRRHGSETAVVDHVGVRRLTCSWAELAELSARVRAELERRDIAPGNRVLLWGRNSAEWIAAFFGCVLHGALVVPLDAVGSKEFAARVQRETAPKLLIGDAALLANLSGPSLLFERFSELPPPDYTPNPALNRSTPLQIIFTSGTTAEPKGIVHTHGNVLASLDPIEREMARYLKYERLVHPLRFLHTLPLSHVFGQFMGLWVPPLLGAELHFESRLEAPRLIRLLKRERISVLAAVPRVLELLRSHLLHLDPELQPRLAQHAEASALKRWWIFRRQHWLLGLKFWALICGGATLSPDLERFWTGLGLALIQGYGMTETTALVTLNHPFRATRGSIGQPLAGREVRIAADGEILVRGESIADAEWREGALRFRQAEDGWLATGDLAAEGSGGSLVFTGRKSDVLVTGAGLNIHPADLEAALLRQPGVRAAAVVPHDTPGGPQPVAVLILQPPPTSSAGSDAVQRANAALADYQQIRRSLVWPGADFPRTSTGKVLRRRIAAWADAALSEKAISQDQSLDPLLTAIAGIPGASAAGASDASRLVEDIHLDSLGLVELQSTIESRFGLEIDEMEWQGARTVGDLRRILNLSGAPKLGTNIPLVSATAADTRLQASDAAQGRYPQWPWSAPVRWLRSAFLEGIMRPLTRLLLAPRIERQVIDEDLRRPLLIVCNHVTAFDVPLVLYALPPCTRRRVAVAMAAHILVGWRYGRAERHKVLSFLTLLAYWLVTALFNVFPLPQGAGFRRSFAHAGEALDRGMHVLLFPEGRRSAGDCVDIFQSGIGLLAQESGASVLPVYLEGLGPIKRGERQWFRPGTVTIRIGRPLTMSGGETPQDFTVRLRTAVVALSREEDS